MNFNELPEEKKKQIMMGGIGAAVLVVIILCVSLFSGGDSESSNVTTPSEQTTATTPGDMPADEDIVVQPEFNEEYGILMKFTEEYETLGDDFLGRISIANTLLDSNVAQGDDNAFYLDHDFDSEYFIYGVPFVDFRAIVANGYQSDVLTLYGHNSSNGDYFEPVKDYRDIDHYKENPIVQFDTLYEEAKYVVIGYFVEYVQGDFFGYHDYVDFNQEGYNNYMTELDKRNYYDHDIDVQFGDKFIALSTCNDDIQGPTNTPYREILVARKLRAGETINDIDLGSISPNEDCIMPEGWQTKNGKVNPYA